MKKYQKVIGILWVSLLMLNSGCSNAGSKDQKVEEAFEQHLSIYPVKSLEDFYDMEGFRDKNFDKDDKGTWVLNANIATQSDEEEPLYSKGIVLYINKNNKQGKGKVYFDTYNNDVEKDKSETYDVKLINGQIILTDKHSKKAEKFVKNFRFLVQDQKIDNLEKLDKLDSRHNSNAPLYTIDYKLPKNHSINKWLQKYYGIDLSDSVMFLKQTGELTGDSTGNFDIKIRKKEDGSIKLFRESINFNPSY